MNPQTSSLFQFSTELDANDDRYKTVEYDEELDGYPDAPPSQG